MVLCLPQIKNKFRLLNLQTEMHLAVYVECCIVSAFREPETAIF